MIIYTTSVFMAHALTHYVARNAKANWACANGDIMKAIVNRICDCGAAIHFRFLCGSAAESNGSLTAAADLARKVLYMPVVTEVPLVSSPRPLDNQHREVGRPRVSTDVPAPAENHSRAENAFSGQDDSWLSSHRNRSKMLRRRDAYCAKLLQHARGSANFWKIFKEYTGSSAVANDSGSLTAVDLCSVFEERMNPPNILPQSFDEAQYHINETLASVLPSCTRDVTAEKFFDRVMTVDDVDRAKELHPG
ncbi:hypothetical protein GYMLUDRAFT_59196 [Collybiopsis luxurians FD-317 M1]|uniref:Uncharacterized protein n=1 Tax=Collybiopsis luxurians FD-317 M1 TaxID=944289 RepID=A0A0D0CPF9_9AGAR|nr:hypothetical protein GYMLUDRAFT_59196 [Collybiopsis luxurians FD-317 M1]